MNDDKLTEVLPMTRVAPALRARLDRIVANSVSRRPSDHIRYAIEAYVAEEEQRLDLPPIVAPTANTAVTAG